MLQLAQPEALLERVDHDQVGGSEQLGIELLLPHAIRSKGRDVRPRAHVVGHEDRLP